MERLEKLVTAIVDEKPVEAGDIFKSEMGDRIKDVLSQRKLEIGKKLFASRPKAPSQLDRLINPEE